MLQRFFQRFRTHFRSFVIVVKPGSDDQVLRQEQVLSCFEKGNLPGEGQSTVIRHRQLRKRGKKREREREREREGGERGREGGREGDGYFHPFLFFFFVFFFQKPNSILKAEAATSHDFLVMSNLSKVVFALMTFTHLTFALLSYSHCCLIRTVEIHTSCFAPVPIALLSFALLSRYQVREPGMVESRASAVIDSSEKFLQACVGRKKFSPLMSGTKNRIFTSFAVLSHRKLLPSDLNAVQGSHCLSAVETSPHLQKLTSEL